MKQTSIPTFVFMLMFLGAALALTPCSVDAKPIKIATSAPEGSSWMKGMRSGAAKIKERTNGRVELKIYGGGVMGAGKSVLRKIRVGQLNGGVFTLGQLADVYPDVQLYTMPLTYRSQAEADYIRTKMDKTLQDGLEKKGFITFGLAQGGAAMLMGNKPFKNMDDLKGQKIWVPEGDKIGYAVMEKLELSPVTLPLTDVLTGLQAGLLDVIGTSPIGAIVLQWHTKVKFVSTTPLLYLYGVMAMDKRVFAKLSPEDQVVVREEMEAVYKNFDTQNAKDNVSAMQALKKQGLTFVDADPKLIENFRKAAAEVTQKLAKEGVYSKAGYQTLMKELNNFRNK